MSLYLGDQIISGQSTLVGESRNIGQIIPSAIPLTDAGLHLLDGSLILGNGIYSAFVDYIASIYDPTANYFCTESEWQTAVTAYGVCGKFVYDSVNNTVRLPKITGIVEGTTDVSALGDLVEAGLPNITGKFGVKAGTTAAPSGAVYTISTGGGSYDNNFTGNDFYGIDASRSSSIYGNSSTVQPQTIKAFYYIVIATSTKTDIQVDIDEIATDLNGKADVDLSNINASQSAKNEIISWGMPDFTAAIDISSASSYSCPSAGYLRLYAVYNGYIYYKSNLYTQVPDWTYNSVGVSGRAAGNWFIVQKNEVLTRVDISGSSKAFFYPLKGVNND